MPARVTHRRFPPPWSVEEGPACFIVRDCGGQSLAYISITRRGIYARKMKVKCPNCPAEQELGPFCDDLRDRRYLVVCPVLDPHLIERHSDTNIECPHMRDARAAVILEHRRNDQRHK
jgi:hypothetical protein